MPLEIEHKYLVDSKKWELVIPEKSDLIKQGYLSTDPNKTIRIRTKGNQGFITVKGKSLTASRPEYEYEIPLHEAEEMLQAFCNQWIEKIRHYITHENKRWEVDVFHGENQGLIVAEIELESETEPYSIPEWATENITFDRRFSNSSLSVHPYSKW